MTPFLDKSLQLQLLGNFLFSYNGQPLTGIDTPRLQSLLAYLVLQQNTPQMRKQLAFLFWPDSSEAQALTNLRKQLLLLRRALPADNHFLYTDSKMVQWKSDPLFTLDVAEFEQALARANASVAEAAIAALQVVITLYRGDLLSGCYDDWIAPKRAELSAKYVQALERLVLLYEDRRDYPAAIQIGQHLLRHDPLHETTYRRLMRLHALNGDRGAALTVYHTCIAVLQRELAVEPTTDTRAAYERLLHEQIPVVLRKPLPISTVTQSPFVGRRAEWQTLHEVWRQVQRGHAHFILISGEAGIGKTRLAEELLDWADHLGITTAHARTFAAEGRLPYAPLVEWLRTPALKSNLMQLDEIWLTELARLLPELLSERTDLTPPNPNTESWQRHRLFEALARAMLVGKQPLLFVLDDLQWCDQETLEWLHFLLRYAPAAPLLVGGTVRPEEIGPHHPLTSLRNGLHSTQQWAEVNLTALNAPDTVQLAQQMIGAELAPDLADGLYRDTEGNPLFIVEMMRAASGEGMREWGRMDKASSPTLVHRSSLSPLPLKIQAVIESRLAQLSPLARKLADVAATMGRDFTFDVLVHAGDNTEDEVMNGLDELWRRHIVREQGAGVYDFSHDKIREVTYSQISATRRRLLHRRIAQAIESIYAANLAAVSGQLGAHYEQAAAPAQAIPYYQRAAQAALRVYACHEAIEHFQRGLALLADQPASVDKDRQELAFLIELSPALVATQGYGASQVHEVYIRAQRLTQQLSEPPNPAILRALAIFYLTRSNYAQAHTQAEEILALAYQRPDDVDQVLYIEGHYVKGVTAFWQGEFLQARAHLTQAIMAYNIERHNTHVTLYSQDPGAVCRIRLALVLWYLGYLDQAQQLCIDSLALARQLAHPLTLVYTLLFAAWLAHDRYDDQAMALFAEETCMLCRKHELPYWLTQGLAFQGKALTEQGEITGGITQIQASIKRGQTIPAYPHLPQCLLMLAQAYMRINADEQALASLEQALASIIDHDDRCYAAELHRRKGALLEQMGSAPGIVERYFQQAYTIARAQQAKLLELRAAVSLSRLWSRQGKQLQARQLLAETYDWFTEGFNTPDLQAAQALLAELS